MRRRLALAAAALAAPAAAVGQPRGVRAEQRLRCGAELALMASGLARALQGAFGRDTGLAVQLLAAPATALLAALRDGEVDCALCNAPDEEAVLERAGLAHARLRVATGSFVLVGPGGRPAAPLPAGAVDAFAALARGAATADAPFLTPGDGSGTHLAELRLWRAAGVEPRPPWHRPAAPDRDILAQARDGGAWVLAERGAWLATGGAGRARVAVQGDPALDVPVHALRAFRSPHPAGRLWSAWVGGARGRAAAAARPGYRRGA